MNNEKEKPNINCESCEDTGWILDYLGGCGDPDCCGGPFSIPCPYCVKGLEYEITKPTE